MSDKDKGGDKCVRCKRKVAGAQDIGYLLGPLDGMGYGRREVICRTCYKAVGNFIRGHFRGKPTFEIHSVDGINLALLDKELLLFNYHVSDSLSWKNMVSGIYDRMDPPINMFDLRNQLAGLGRLTLDDDPGSSGLTFTSSTWFREDDVFICKGYWTDGAGNKQVLCASEHSSPLQAFVWAIKVRKAYEECHNKESLYYIHDYLEKAGIVI